MPGEESPEVSIRRGNTLANLSAIPRENLIGKLLRAPLRLIPLGMVVPTLQGALRGKKWTVGSRTHGCDLQFKVDGCDVLDMKLDPALHDGLEAILM